MKIKTEKEYLWTAVAMDIEKKIITQEYKTGDVIPSLNELTEMYKVGKPTAQKVLNDLSDRGIIVKEVGRGSYVKNDSSVRKKLVAKQKRQFLYYVKAIKQISETLGMTTEDVLDFIEKNL